MQLKARSRKAVAHGYVYVITPFGEDIPKKANALKALILMNGGLLNAQIDCNYYENRNGME